MNVLSRWSFIFFSIFLLLIGCGSDSPKKSPEVIVTLPNALPSIQTEEVLSLQFDKSISLVAVGSDTDGEVISYLWSQTGGAEVELINANNATASFQPKQELSEDIEYLFDVQVIDNDQGSHTKSVKVQVKSLLSVIQSEVLKSCITSHQETNSWILTEDIKQLDCHAENLDELGYLISLESLNLEFSGSNFQIDAPENLVNLHSITVSCMSACYISPIFDYSPLNTVFDINSLSTLPNLLEITLRTMRLDEVNSLTTFDTLTDLSLFNIELTESIKILFTNSPQLKNLLVSNNEYTLSSLDTIDFSVMPNLVKLSLPTLSLKNVSTLSGLPELESLKLNIDELNDIGFLEGLNKLTFLELACRSCSYTDNFLWNSIYKEKGKIADASVVENLTQLKVLRINDSIIESLDLRKLTKLQELNLFNNSIQHFNLPEDNDLEMVNISFNRLTNTEFMRNLSADVQFSAYRNFFSCQDLELQQTDIDVSGVYCLSQASNFEHLKVKDDYLLNCLYPMIQDESNENIDSINCGWEVGTAGSIEYVIHSLEGLEQFNNLKSLKVINSSTTSSIESLEPLAEISTLTRLSIDSNNITDIKPLQNLQNLEIINLPNVEGADINIFLGWDKDLPINCIAMKLTDDDKQKLLDHFSDLTLEDYRCYFE